MEAIDYHCEAVPESAKIIISDQSQNGVVDNSPVPTQPIDGSTDFSAKFYGKWKYKSW